MRAGASRRPGSPPQRLLLDVLALLAPGAVLVAVAGLLAAPRLADVRDATRPTISHFWLLPYCWTRCLHPLLRGCNRAALRSSGLQAVADGLVRPDWETAHAPLRGVLLLTADGRRGLLPAPPPFLRGVGQRSRSTEREREPREHHEVGVKLYALQGRTRNGARPSRASTGRTRARRQRGGGRGFGTHPCAAGYGG